MGLLAAQALRIANPFSSEQSLTWPWLAQGERELDRTCIMHPHPAATTAMLACLPCCLATSQHKSHAASEWMGKTQRTKHPLAR